MNPLCLVIRAYQIFLSPILAFITGAGSGCRFTPTCSQYMLEAIQRHGTLRGCWLGVKRLAHCQPWGGQGYDPVPGKEDDTHSTQNFSWIKRP